MWEEVASQIVGKGGNVKVEAEVRRIYRTGNVIRNVETIDLRTKATERFSGTEFISSMPLSELVLKMDPIAPEPVRRAAEKLCYRDFLTVCLIVNDEQIFSDNWIYIHDANVKVGRIQNYKNWSPKMVPDKTKSSLGLEYFCNQGDSLWSMSDDDLVDLAKREIQDLGLIESDKVVDGCVFRVEKSYPVYDSSYRDHLATLREFVDGFSNLQTIGRNGLHRYNNQDHAMITGFLAAGNIINGTTNDVWSVNEDKQYHEELQRNEELSTNALNAGSLGPTLQFQPAEQQSS